MVLAGCHTRCRARHREPPRAAQCPTERVFRRRAGDYALAMCAAFLRFEDGRIVEARIGVGGATDRPLRIAAAEAVLTGTDGGPGVRHAAGNVAAETIDPLEGIHASAPYR